VLSSVDYFWKERHAMLSAQLLEPIWSTASSASLPLFLLTIGLLFLPKVFALILAWRERNKFGGGLPLLLSSLIEMLTAFLLAPVLLYFYCRFVLLALLGIKVSWKTQNRTDSAIPWSEALRVYGEPTLIGIVGSIVAFIYVPELVPWLAPALLGLLLSIPLAMILSLDKLGVWLRQRGLLLIPEEQHAPAELDGLSEDTPAEQITVRIKEEHQGLMRVTLDPYVNATHIAILRRTRRHSRAKQDYLDRLRERLLAEGPTTLTRRELMALLWDAEALHRLHRTVWRTAEEALHPWWRRAMHRYNEAGSQLETQSRVPSLEIAK
jgi:membrane glycosyltransferase